MPGVLAQRAPVAPGLPIPTVALLGATALHAGFQLTVSGVVYPALARRPSPDWAERHQQHSRQITPLVGLVYGSVLPAAAVAVAAAPRRRSGWLAAAGTAAALAVTATRAAPLHGRLARQGPEPRLLRALRRADALRSLSAVVALAAAVAYARE